MANRLLNPFGEMDALSRVLDTSLNSNRLNPFSVSVTQFPMDLFETRDEFFVHAYLPGVAKDHIAVELDGNQLTIRAERPLPEHEGMTWLHVESPHGTFYRTVTLGSGIQGDHIEAAWREGMLLIRIPKVEHARSKVIPIHVDAAHEDPKRLSESQAQ